MFECEMDSFQSRMNCRLKCVLFPFTIGWLPIKAYVWMDRYSVIRQHPLVYPVAHVRCDGLGGSRINKESSGLKNEHDAGTEISTKAPFIARRRPHNKHLAPLKGEFPEWIIRRSLKSRATVMLMKHLQYLPEAINESNVGCNPWIRLEERDQAATPTLRCAQQRDKFMHVSHKL